MSRECGSLDDGCQSRFGSSAIVVSHIDDFFVRFNGFIQQFDQKVLRCDRPGFWLGFWKVRKSDGFASPPVTVGFLLGFWKVRKSDGFACSGILPLVDRFFFAEMFTIKVFVVGRILSFSHREYFEFLFRLGWRFRGKEC